MDPKTRILAFVQATGATPYPALQEWWQALPHAKNALVNLTLDAFLYELLCEGRLAVIQDKDPTIFLAVASRSKSD